MVFLDHVQNLHIHAEKTHKDSGAHCMNMLILYMVQKTHTGPYYRVQALFMYGVVQSEKPFCFVFVLQLYVGLFWRTALRLHAKLHFQVLVHIALCSTVL